MIAASPALGATAITIPAEGHQVFRVSLSANDWVIGYGWAPGTRDAAATIHVLAPSTSDVAGDAVATSTASGVIWYKAPAAGTYSIDFSAEPGTRIARGLFLSRPSLAPSRASVVTVPYGGTYTASCVLRDSLYNYVSYDGPVLAFENVVFNVSRNGGALAPAWRGQTDLGGKASRPIKGITRTLQYAFGYSGAVYASAAFGPATTGVVTVVPRVGLTVTAPKRVTHSRGFRVAGTLQPSTPLGPSSTVIEVHKKGNRRVSRFAMSALGTKRGASLLAGAAMLPSAGTWYVRLHRPAESGYAETATKWVTVSVR